MTESNEKIRPRLYKLKVVEEIEFPIEQMRSVRTQASELGLLYNRKYKTWTDRATRTITVKRLF